MNLTVSEEMLSALREEVRSRVSERTYSHILGVEREVCSLCGIFLPEKTDKARAAALLHDVTKNESTEKQLQYLNSFGIITDTLIDSPKILHSKTAAALIPTVFPRFNDDEIVSAVWWHTTGRAEMTLFEAIVYLADYIEDTRTYEDCVELRRYFYDNVFKLDSPDEKMLHFYKTMVKSFDYTINHLIDENSIIDRDTIEARNYFLRSISKYDMRKK